MIDEFTLDDVPTQQLIEELLERSTAAILVRMPPSNMEGDMEVCVHWTGPDGTLAELVRYIEQEHSLTATLGIGIDESDDAETQCQDQ